MRQPKKKNFIKRNSQLIFVFLLDLFFTLAAYGLASVLVFSSIAKDTVFAGNEIFIVLAYVIIILSMLVFFDCYTAVWKYAGRVEFFKILLAYISSFAIILMTSITLNRAFKLYIPSTLIIITLVFSLCLSSGVRFMYSIGNYVMHVKSAVDGKSNTGLMRTIVVGAGLTGTAFVNRCFTDPADGFTPVAFVDDNRDLHGKTIHGVSVEGNTHSLEYIIGEHKAGAIVIAISSISKSSLKRIYGKCASFNIPIKIIAGLKDAGTVSNSSIELRDVKIEELLGREEFKINQDLIDQNVKDKVVMVTGGAGSIGSELCRQALTFGCKHLVIYDNHENGMFALNEEFKQKYDTSRYTLSVGSVREKIKVSKIMEKYKPSVVFHAAAYKHVPMMELSATEAVKNNVFGTLNVMEEAERNGAEKFIFISTDKAVNPANVMGASKRIAEMLIQCRGKNSKMNMAAVRFGNVLGSNGSVIPIFLEQIRKGGPITLTDKNIKRYFMTIPEAVRLVLQAGALATKGDVFVLDMGEPVYIYDLACDLIRISGLVPEKDIEIEVTGLRPGEKLFEELRYDQESTDRTVHSGIFVTRLVDIDEKAFEKQIAELNKNAFSEEDEKTIETVFGIVPSSYRNMDADKQINSSEFKSQGSRGVGVS